MRPLLLLTRPDPQARSFASLATAECPPHDLLIAPLSEVVSIPFEASDVAGAKALVLTSINAVSRVAGLVPRGLTAWCVGPGTANAAQKAGLTVREGGGDALALIETLCNARPEGPLVHAHGVHLARDLVAALQPKGIDIQGVAVYEARVLDWPDAVRAAVFAAPRIIAPLFSPRAAVQIVQQLRGIRPEGMRLVAISEACAARLPEAFRARTTIAATPDSAGMMQAIASELSQSAKDGLRQA